MTSAPTPEPQAGVVTVVVGDGQHSNALGVDGWRHLADRLQSLSDDPATLAVVLTGHGHTFTAGSDLTEWDGADLQSVERCFTVMEDCFQTIEQLEVPVIAAIEGTALGAGCQLALSCDLVVMGESARIGMPIARLGILASPAFAARVSARAGTAIAADLYLTGRALRADEACTRGLVARVVPDGAAYEMAHGLAAQIGAHPTASVTAAKRALLSVSRPDQVDPGQRRAPSVAIREFHAAVSAFVHRHDRAEAS